MDDLKKVARLEKILGYDFKKKSLALMALTHASYRKISGICNERLEFLGDAVLGLVITDMLYRRYREMEEGELTRFKGHLVSRRTLAIMSREMKFRSLALVGSGLPEKYPDSFYANLFEAIVGAWYLDGGLGRVKKWLVSVFESRVALMIDNRHEKNHKSILQQFCQKLWKHPPVYHCLEQRGPDHSKEFDMRVTLTEELFFEASGKSRKQAEQKAAGRALRYLKRRVAWKRTLEEILG
jgi:ribonuclease-3